MVRLWRWVVSTADIDNRVANAGDSLPEGLQEVVNSLGWSSTCHVGCRGLTRDGEQHPYTHDLWAVIVGELTSVPAAHELLGGDADIIACHFVEQLQAFLSRELVDLCSPVLDCHGFLHPTLQRPLPAHAMQIGL